MKQFTFIFLLFLGACAVRTVPMKNYGHRVDSILKVVYPDSGYFCTQLLRDTIPGNPYMVIPHYEDKIAYFREKANTVDTTVSKEQGYYQYKFYMDSLFYYRKAYNDSLAVDTPVLIGSFISKTGKIKTFLFDLNLNLIGKFNLKKLDGERKI